MASCLRRPWLLLLVVSLALVCCLLPAAAAQDSCPPDDACRSEPGAALCSGRGECTCGLCDCYRQDITGRFCECDNGSCPRTDGLICSGPSRGVCECGRCRCHPGWQGEACDCLQSTASCKQPGSDRICNGKGSCECGRCRCYRHGNEAYSGEFCETCPTCVSKCDAYRNCAECLAFKTGPLANHCQTACGQVSIQMEDDPRASDSSERLCSFFTSEGCRFQFVYNSGGRLRVHRHLQCPVTVAPMAPAVAASNGSSSGAADATVSAGTVLAATAIAAAATWRQAAVLRT